MPSPKSASQGSRTSGGSRSPAQSGGSSDGSTGVAEQLLNRFIKPMGLVGALCEVLGQSAVSCLSRAASPDFRLA